MIAQIRRQAEELFEDWQGSHHERLWPHLKERCEELAEKRILQIQMFFSMKRTGSPFPSPEELRAKKSGSAG